MKYNLDGSISELPVVKLGLSTEKQQHSLLNATEWSEGDIKILDKILAHYEEQLDNDIKRDTNAVT